LKHLVTGSSGFLGSQIVKKLVSDGHEVVSLDIIEDPELAKISQFYRIDISEKSHNYKKIFNKVDYVHHNAALVPLTKAGKNFFNSNVEGTRNILNQSIKYNVEHFSHMSSSAIFGKPEKNKNVNYNKYKPTSLYGYSKYLAEVEVINNYNENVKNFKSCSIIRPRPVVGSGRLGIFEILFDWVSEDKKIPIIGNGNNKFQFAHIDDLVDVSIETSLRNISGFFNIGTDNFTTLREDLNETFKKVGSKSRVIGIPESICKPSLFVLDKLGLSPLSSWHYLSYSWEFHYDLKNTMRILKWRPKFSNQEMICQAYNWYTNNKQFLNLNGSSHRSKVKQGALKIIKKFL
tara:strand:- start:140 stop:1177 length:1038 start_codon:yes stop_codon:yes gene_type:complete